MMATTRVLHGLALTACTANAAWVDLQPATTPPARTVACFAQVKTGTLMFGGSGPKGMLADTWLWHDGDWHDVSSLGGGKAPPGRALGAMAAYKDGAVRHCLRSERACACNRRVGLVHVRLYVGLARVSLWLWWWWQCWCVRARVRA